MSVLWARACVYKSAWQQKYCSGKSWDINKVVLYFLLLNVFAYCSCVQERHTQYWEQLRHRASFRDVLLICSLQLGSSNWMIRLAHLSFHILILRSITRRYLHTSCFYYCERLWRSKCYVWILNYCASLPSFVKAVLFHMVDLPEFS